MPYSSRPPESTSTMAYSSARRSGWWSGTSETPVPTRMREVRAAAAVAITAGEPNEYRA